MGESEVFLCANFHQVAVTLVSAVLAGVLVGAVLLLGFLSVSVRVNSHVGDLVKVGSEYGWLDAGGKHLNAAWAQTLSEELDVQTVVLSPRHGREGE